VLEPYREGQVSALNRLKKGAPKVANNINEWGWETLAQRRLIAQMCAFFKACTEGRSWKAIGNKVLKPCYLIMENHNRKFRNRKKKMLVNIPS
jgi:hypothetical protein